MDQYIAGIIVAVITGIFGTIAIIIQKGQNKIVTKIDEQTMFIEKEKAVKQKLLKFEKERESLIQQIMVLILNTNIYLVQHITSIEHTGDEIDFVSMSEELKRKFNEVTEEINELTKEYELILDMSLEFQKELERQNEK